MQMVAVPYTGPTPRLMAFIDGENLVARYQAMRERGKQPQAGTQHAPDEYVWNPGFHLPGRFEVIRAHHYASVVGDEPKVADVGSRIKSVRFCANDFSSDSTSLYAHVFKKPSKSQKTSTVDIQMVVDALSHTYQRTADTILLVTGDGDFEPLAEEIAGRGIKLLLAALSDGLSTRLMQHADRFIDLDPWLLARPA